MILIAPYRIDASPPKQTSALPGAAPVRASNGHEQAPIPVQAKASFQPIKAPTQPRSNIPLSRPLPASSSGNPQNHSKPAEEPVVVIDEVVDAEKVLEERRKKREEIMAKFRANGGKPTITSATSPAPRESSIVDAGVDSVGSAGVVTQSRTGVSSITCM